jgi:hypothetical protein
MTDKDFILFYFIEKKVSLKSYLTCAHELWRLPSRKHCKNKWVLNPLLETNVLRCFQCQSGKYMNWEQ